MNLNRNNYGLVLGYDGFSEHTTREIICNLKHVQAEVTADSKQYGFSRLETLPDFGLAALTKEIYWQTHGTFPDYSFIVAGNWNSSAPTLTKMGLLEKFNGNGIRIPPVTYVLAHLLIAGAQHDAMLIKGRNLEKIESYLGLSISNYCASFNSLHI